jgi:PTH1 family peptidyl-tRNA hydrolase
MSAIQLIVGLGNPGQKYEQTRHNIGFMVVDRLADVAGVSMTNHLRWRAHVAKSPRGAILMKPQTFMNLSGQSVGAALRFYKWQPEQVLVVYDDISLPFGALRFRMAGSAGGHNGMKSIISHLGSDRFPRLKIGIGALMRGAEPLENGAQNEGGGARSGSLVGHVLGKFSTEERNELQNTLATAAEAVQVALSEGVEAAANAFNTKKKRDTP